MSGPEEAQQPMPEQDPLDTSDPEDWWDGMTDQEVENWLEGSD